MLGLKLNHVSKRGPWAIYEILCDKYFTYIYIYICVCVYKVLHLAKRCLLFTIGFQTVGHIDESHQDRHFEVYTPYRQFRSCK